MEKIFKRKFSLSMYKNLKFRMSEMSFSKDFATDDKGDLYPILEKSDDLKEEIKSNLYAVKKGSVKRFFSQFFPYATYELTADIKKGKAGFSFGIPQGKAEILMGKNSVTFSCGDVSKKIPIESQRKHTLIVSCRPGAFDVYIKKNKPELISTFKTDTFKNSNDYKAFSSGFAALMVTGNITVYEVLSYMDNGISIADMRTIRYENGDILTEQGKVFLSVSIRLEEEWYQGIVSWVPGTAEFELTGALFYDCGDGKWCNDVAASILYHRGENKWYLWVCSFSHGHILAHSEFFGDPRFGVNIVDINLMDEVPTDSDVSVFAGISSDEDPDFFYEEETKKWYMAICRLDRTINSYRYVFFESDCPFSGYKFIGKGYDGSETGGSFTRIDGELCFVCGNGYDKKSNYRIYKKDGMKEAVFDYPDGGCRGWGTIIPVELGSRTRHFWLTFDRHNGSEYTWSYGNVYCFEAE